MKHLWGPGGRRAVACAVVTFQENGSASTGGGLGVQLQKYLEKAPRASLCADLWFAAVSSLGLVTSRGAS